MSDEPLFVSIERAAILLDLSRGTIYNMLNRGELPSRTFGRSRRIPFSALKQLDKSNTAAHNNSSEVK